MRIPVKLLGPNVMVPFMPAVPEVSMAYTAHIILILRLQLCPHLPWRQFIFQAAHPPNWSQQTPLTFLTSARSVSVSVSARARYATASLSFVKIFSSAVCSIFVSVLASSPA